jgi:NAD(P)-dependent dehydrogenase (short-subunit alcohol dehydrogenase family)
MARQEVVVITGASTGIGEACALHLDELGFRVFAGVRKRADGEALKGRASERLAPVPLDVTDERTIAAAVETVADAAGDMGLVGLVNNAGIAVAGMLEFLPLAMLRNQLEVNVLGPIAVTQAFLPLLRKAPGRVVNIGSNSGLLSTPFLGAYCASKFALEALTDALRLELRPWGIKVSIIEPGNIQTPIWEKSSAAAKQLLEGLPRQAHELYGTAIAAVRKAAEKSAASAIPPGAVARAVTHALTAKRPKTRYRVGTDATFQAQLARYVPDRMRDAIIARFMGIP